MSQGRDSETWPPHAPLRRCQHSRDCAEMEWPCGRTGHGSRTHRAAGHPCWPERIPAQRAPDPIYRRVGTDIRITCLFDGHYGGSLGCGQCPSGVSSRIGPTAQGDRGSHAQNNDLGPRLVTVATITQVCGVTGTTPRRVVTLNDSGSRTGAMRGSKQNPTHPQRRGRTPTPPAPPFRPPPLATLNEPGSREKPPGVTT